MGTISVSRTAEDEAARTQDEIAFARLKTNHEVCDMSSLPVRIRPLYLTQ